MYKFELDLAETRAILSSLRERLRKFQKGIDKFGDNFDPELGRGLIEGVNKYQALIHKMQEQMTNV